MVITSAVDEALSRAVEVGDVPGVVAIAADNDGIAYQGAFGVRALGQAENMTMDTVFWMASMTKPLTAVAAMQLVERGKLALDEPLGPLMPELASPQVLEGFDADGVPRLRSTRGTITLRRLLTHTSGFAYEMFDADLLRYIQLRGIPGIGERKRASLYTPLMFDPGERWEYGISFDWVGRIIERMSGQSLDDYLREHVCGPLGMADTGFPMTSAQQSRMAGRHRRTADGSLEQIPAAPAEPPEYFSGGGGAYSTGPDYLTLLRTLMNGGRLGDTQILRPDTVAEMGRNQIGDLSVGALRTATPNISNDIEFFPGMIKKWGLGFMINTEVASTGRSAGSLAWAGLANTYFWLDSTKRVAGVLLTQILPFADAKVLHLFDEFERAIYAGNAA